MRQRMPSISEIGMLKMETDPKVETSCQSVSDKRIGGEITDNCAKYSVTYNENNFSNYSAFNEINSLMPEKKTSSIVDFDNYNSLDGKKSSLPNMCSKDFDMLKSNLKSKKPLSENMFDRNAFFNHGFRKKGSLFSKMDNDSDSFFGDDEFFNTSASNKLISKSGQNVFNKGLNKSHDFNRNISKKESSSWKNISFKVDAEDNTSHATFSSLNSQRHFQKISASKNAEDNTSHGTTYSSLNAQHKFQKISASKNTDDDTSHGTTYSSLNSQKNFQKITASKNTEDDTSHGTTYSSLNSQQKFQKISASKNTEDDTNHGTTFSSINSQQNFQKISASKNAQDASHGTTFSSINSQRHVQKMSASKKFGFDKVDLDLHSNCKRMDKLHLQDRSFDKIDRSCTPEPIITYPSDDEDDDNNTPEIISPVEVKSVIVDCDSNFDHIQKFLESIENTSTPLNESKTNNHSNYIQNMSPISPGMISTSDEDGYCSSSETSPIPHYGFNTFPLRKNNKAMNSTSDKLALPSVLKFENPYSFGFDTNTGDEMDKLMSVTAKLRLDTKRPSIMAWKEQAIEKPNLWRHRIAHEVVNRDISKNATEDRVMGINEAIVWLKNELEVMRSHDQTLARTFVYLRHNISSYKLERSVAHHAEIIEDAVEIEIEKHNEFSDVLDHPPDQFNPRLKQLGVTPMNINRRRFSVF